MTDLLPEHLQSNAAEKALIGALGHHAASIAHVLDSLPGADFYDPHRGAVWSAASRLSAEREPVEPTRIARALVAADAWNAATQRVVHVELNTASPASHAGKHAETVADLARRRELLRAITRAQVILRDHPGDASDLLSAIRGEFDQVAPETTSKSKGGPLDWGQLIDEFEQAHAPGGSKPGIPTPWWELDRIIGGIYGGRMYVVGGRPAQGKSTVAGNIATYVAVEHRKPVLMISKEMPTVDVTGRILASLAEADLHDINARRINDVDMARIRQHIRKVGDVPLWVDASPRNLAGIKSLARAHHHRHGLALLVVDYLQLVRTDTPGKSRENEVAEVSRQLKALALELDIPVLLPAQLNRESVKRSDPRPTMADLRDSGQIEQDSDVIILLYHPLTADGQPTGQIELIVDKNRHGPRNEVSLRWSGGYGRVG